MSSRMAARYEVEVRITSASDLKNVNWRHGNLKPYAVASMDRLNETATYVGGDATSYRWDQALLIPFSTPIEESTLFIDIKQAEAADDIKPIIGSAQVALRNVRLGVDVKRTLQLQRPSGRPQGKVKVSFTVRNLGSGQRSDLDDNEFYDYDDDCGWKPTDDLDNDDYFQVISCYGY